MAGCHLELVESLPSLHSNFKGDYSLSHRAKALLLKEAMLLFRFLLEFTPYFDTEQE